MSEDCVASAVLVASEPLSKLCVNNKKPTRAKASAKDARAKKEELIIYRNVECEMRMKCKAESKLMGT